MLNRQEISNAELDAFYHTHPQKMNQYIYEARVDFKEGGTTVHRQIKVVAPHATEAQKMIQRQYPNAKVHSPQNKGKA